MGRWLRNPANPAPSATLTGANFELRRCRMCPPHGRHLSATVCAQMHVRCLPYKQESPQHGATLRASSSVNKTNIRKMDITSKPRGSLRWGCGCTTDVAPRDTQFRMCRTSPKDADDATINNITLQTEYRNCNANTNPAAINSTYVTGRSQPINPHFIVRNTTL